MRDRLAAWADRLAELDELPIATHPDLLDELHRELVDELDSLAVSRAPADGDASPPAAGG